MNKKQKKEIEFTAHRLGLFQEKISQKGKHYFQGNLLVGGRSYDVLLFENGEYGKRRIYAMLSSKLFNFY